MSDELRKQSIARADSRRSMNDQLEKARLKNQMAALNQRLEEVEPALETLQEEKKQWLK